MTTSSLNEPTLKEQYRFLSLDVFRGITVCLMIIVNCSGKGAEPYAFLTHAKWFGFTLADLVFPSFLFAVGNAMSFTQRKNTGSVIPWKVIKRTLLIFMIGYLLYWFPFVRHMDDGTWVMKPFSETRIMGVLQRIALCYFMAVLIVRHVPNQLYLVSALLLGIYWAALYIFGDDGAALTMEGNAVGKLDLFLFGQGHLYKRDIPFDPEGLLSTLPSIVNVLAGYVAGVYIRSQQKNTQTTNRLLVVGVVLTIASLLTGFVIPISKKLWTPSFTLLTCGLDVIMLALLVLVIEIKGWRRGTYFFNVFGKNPLFIYLLSELLHTVLKLITTSSGQRLWDWIGLEIFQFILPGSIGALATAVWFMFTCWFIGWIFDRKQIYIRL